MIVRYEIPIENYHCDGVFFKNLFFQCEGVSPRLEEVKNRLKAEHEAESNWSKEHPIAPFCREYAACLETLKLLERESDFPVVSEGRLVHTNTFVNMPKYGRQSVSASIIKIFDAGE